MIVNPNIIEDASSQGDEEYSQSEGSDDSNQKQGSVEAICTVEAI